MPGRWLSQLRQVAARIRDELLGLAEQMELPKSAQEAKAREHEADELACRVLLEGLKEVGFSGILVCEDIGIRELGSPGPSGPYLLVDPLDGTRNFSRGIRIASISMAVCEGPSITGLEEALVLEIFSGREFWAILGRGAFSGQRRLSVSRVRELKEAVLCVDKSHITRETGAWVLDLACSVDATRQLGSASLELCLVASGCVDGYVDLRDRIRPTDVAAGVLIAREAGARVWLRGKLKPEVALSHEEKVRVVAANPDLFAKLAELLEPYMPGGGILLEPGA